VRSGADFAYFDRIHETGAARKLGRMIESAGLKS